MSAIPLNLLQESITVYKVLFEDIWGEVHYYQGVEVENVRVQQLDRFSENSDNRQISPGAIVYYDCSNSVPLNFKFEIGDRVVYNNTNFYVSSIKPLLSEHSIHHYEIGLSNWTMRQM